MRTSISLNFDLLSYLTRVIYLVSNNLVRSWPHNGDMPEIFKILLDHSPRMFVFELLQNHLPTMRATWETLTRYAWRYKLRDAFHFLMKVGLRHHSWIASNGHMYLSFAASMDDPTLV